MDCSRDCSTGDRVLSTPPDFSVGLSTESHVFPIIRWPSQREAVSRRCPAR